MRHFVHGDYVVKLAAFCGVLEAKALSGRAIEQRVERQIDQGGPALAVAHHWLLSYRDVLEREVAKVKLKQFHRLEALGGGKFHVGPWRSALL
jgi:hypothetical protein